MTYREHFLSLLNEDLREEASAITDLQVRVDAMLDAGQQAWPALQVAEHDFIDALARHWNQARRRQTLVRWLDYVQPKDLHLALACCQSTPGAIGAFEDHYKRTIERLLNRYQGPTLPAEDLLQSLREKLFVSTPNRQAKIHSYSGQGFLQNWLRVTGTRTFIDLLRKRNKQDDRELQPLNEQQFLNVPDDLQDMELDFLKREYREQFKEAFAAAARSLSSHQRNLLRQHIVFGLTVEQIGKLYGVHTSTASRRVAKAREALLSATREEFMARMRIQNQEFNSIMDMIRSRLDLSMTRLLQSVTQPPPSKD